MEMWTSQKLIKKAKPVLIVVAVIGGIILVQETGSLFLCGIVVLAAFAGAFGISFYLRRLGRLVKALELSQGQSLLSRPERAILDRSGFHDPAAQAVMLRQWQEVLRQLAMSLGVAGVLALVVFLGVLGYEYGD